MVTKDVLTLDRRLLDILVCPITRERLRQEDGFLVSEPSGVKYPIREGIPVLLLEEAILPPGVKSIEELAGRTNGSPS